eukprot:277207-Amphidinium_carterae.1
MAELHVLGRKPKLALIERLGSGRLLSLPPSAFVSLVHAFRLAHGPVPCEDLRQPLVIAFGALLDKMQPRQIASAIESLRGYASKKNRTAFTHAYMYLAAAVQKPPPPPNALTATEVAAAVVSYAEIQFDDNSVL